MGKFERNQVASRRGMRRTSAVDDQNEWLSLSTHRSRMIKSAMMIANNPIAKEEALCPHSPRENDRGNRKSKTASTALPLKLRGQPANIQYHSYQAVIDIS